MAHVKQSIRDNAVTAVTGLSTTGSSVFRSRVYPLGTNKLLACESNGRLWLSCNGPTVARLFWILQMIMSVPANFIRCMARFGRSGSITQAKLLTYIKWSSPYVGSYEYRDAGKGGLDVPESAWF